MTNLKIIKLQFKTLSESEQEDFINWINKKKAKKTKKVKKEENLKFKNFINNGEGIEKDYDIDEHIKEIKEEQENTSEQLIIEADNLIDFKVKLKKAIDNSINQEKETRIQLNRSEKVKKEYNTEELDEYEKMIKNLDNYFTILPTIKKENLEVGDLFYEYHAHRKYLYVITRMTAKTIFYTSLKRKRYSRWFNHLDHGGSKHITKFNIADRGEGESRKLKTSIDKVIDPSKVNYWGDIYIGNHGL
jgi:hypothetical protein